ncbi:MAG: hypothetical protein LBS27_10555 [Bifidobacteriaceae bacterium]|nr:hypothetical protein [Bifidobacteriaceae bacterium]
MLSTVAQGDGVEADADQPANAVADDVRHVRDPGGEGELRRSQRQA